MHRVVKVDARDDVLHNTKWSPAIGWSLKSAVVGGQHPQTRLHHFDDKSADMRCQLCFDEVDLGTLAHRHRCSMTRPPGGWSPHLTPAEFAILEEMPPAVGNTLIERGLYVSAFPHPLHASTPINGSFQWIEDPTDLDLSTASVYIDGSAYYSDMGPTFTP